MLIFTVGAFVGGYPYLVAESAYALARHNYPNDEAKALSAAKDAFLEHHGAPAFSPVSEIGERYAIKAAKVAFVKVCILKRFSAPTMMPCADVPICVCLREHFYVIWKHTN